MNPGASNSFEAQLDGIIAAHVAMQKEAQHNDLSDLPKDERQSLVTQAIAAVHRISGPTSTYSVEMQRILAKDHQLHLHTSSIIGIVKALRHDVSAGYLQTLVELVHAGVFADFLDMASHLQDSGYKDAAAVICGSALESHLRELCKKYGVSTDLNGKPKKADQINGDLVKSGAYSTLDQKNVTAWLGLRNKAAHGNYQAYGDDQVELLIAGVREFLARTPA